MNDSQYAIKLYIEAAQEALQVANYNIAGGYFGPAINRTYYAFFYTASALLLTKDLRRSKHVGVLAAFRQFFVKEGIMDAKFGEIFGDIFELRNEVDYDLGVKASETEAREYLSQAQEFVDCVIGYLKRGGFYAN